jgi:protein-tyrosine-phosphatase
VDTSEAFVRPVSADVLASADVIVTMGHSVGQIDLPDGVKHLDWRVGDPVGASIDEARRVRADIEWRVRELLIELQVLPAEAATEEIESAAGDRDSET